jgi:2-dehydro-3-deoxyphosphogalactonate aldolase
MTFEKELARTPIVAIIRGVTPDEAPAIAEAMCEAGVRIIEVPLNSPDPFESVKRINAQLGERMIVGVGTVLSVDKVNQSAAAGARILVAPNTRCDVIRCAVKYGMTPLPGFATATEAFEAYDAGARYLKLFPASTYGPGHVKALKAVLPKDAVVLAVGGAGPANMADWWKAGVRGFGLGSELYVAGQSASVTLEKARVAVAAVRALEPQAAEAVTA